MLHTTRTQSPALGTPGGVRRATMHTPIGELTLYASGAGLRGVLWPGEAGGIDASEGDLGADDAASQILRNAIAQLVEYFTGTRFEFDLPLDAQGTEFQRSAWAELRRIPYGETISYAEQARRLGDVNKSRAVGGANGRNPLSIVVPCHRVVGVNGALTGFAAGVDVKQWLLRHEQTHAA